MLVQPVLRRSPGMPLTMASSPPMGAPFSPREIASSAAAVLPISSKRLSHAFSRFDMIHLLITNVSFFSRQPVLRAFISASLLRKHAVRQERPDAGNHYSSSLLRRLHRHLLLLLRLSQRHHIYSVRAPLTVSLFRSPYNFLCLFAG